MSQHVTLVDRFDRVHTSLRISVTDRCNLRCHYCMPEFGAVFAPRESLLTFEEIVRVTRLLATRCGVSDVRLTGGEPLVRKDLPKLIAMLAQISEVGDLSLTTNGVLLEAAAESLRAAGLKRLNISIDTLDEKQFQEISRRKNVAQVVAGIDQAIRSGFDEIKLNATAIKGVTESQIVSLVRFAIDRDVQMRFIEFMPLDSDRRWTSDNVLSGETIRDIIRREFGPLRPVTRDDPAQPATDYVLESGAKVGIIASVTEPFCSSCNRIRLTADGSIRNCLFSGEETPLRDLLRAGATDDQIIEQVRSAVAAKKSGHGIDHDHFQPPDRPMYAIGG